MAGAVNGATAFTVSYNRPVAIGTGNLLTITRGTSVWTATQNALTFTAGQATSIARVVNVNTALASNSALAAVGISGGLLPGDLITVTALAGTASLAPTALASSVLFTVPPVGPAPTITSAVGRFVSTTLNSATVDGVVYTTAEARPDGADAGGISVVHVAGVAANLPTSAVVLTSATDGTITVRVTLGTNASAAVNATRADVVAAVNAATNLVSAATTTPGTAAVAAGPTALDVGVRALDIVVTSSVALTAFSATGVEFRFNGLTSVGTASVVTAPTVLAPLTSVLVRIAAVPFVSGSVVTIGAASTLVVPAANLSTALGASNLLVAAPVTAG